MPLRNSGPPRLSTLQVEADLQGPPGVIGVDQYHDELNGEVILLGVADNSIERRRNDVTAPSASQGLAFGGSRPI
jgi:hypothetical protein